MGQRELVPLAEAGGWRDDVAKMEEILARLKDRVEGLRWVKPPIGSDGHVLEWADGRHEERRLGQLADWADGEWPP